MTLSENDVRDSIETVWSSLVLGLEVAPGRPDLMSHGEPDLLAGCVQITGAWRGAVTLDCSADLARQAAALMFGCEPRHIDHEQVQEASAS